MRYSKEHKQETHARIVRKASVKLRERGAHGIGVADLMKEAGLTHGGFYAHFASREALVIEAFIYAMDRSLAGWRQKTEALPMAERFAAIVESYLSTSHRDDPGRGCALAALAAEIGRESVKTRRAFAGKLGEMIDLLTDAVPEGTEAEKRRQAIAAVATMVGTLILARVGGNGDLSDEILAAGRQALLASPASARRRAARKTSEKGPAAAE